MTRSLLHEIFLTDDSNRVLPINIKARFHRQVEFTCLGGAQSDNKMENNISHKH